MNYINAHTHKHTPPPHPQPKKKISLKEMSRAGCSDKVNPAPFAYKNDCKTYNQPQLFYYIHNYQL